MSDRLKEANRLPRRQRGRRAGRADGAARGGPRRRRRDRSDCPRARRGAGAEWVDEEAPIDQR